jgi:colanic acid/amylovoran biosynthesis glycosyltransferase
LRKAQLKSWQVSLHRKRLVNIALKNRMDIVHSHFGHFGWNDMINSPTKKHKHVVTFYGADVTMLPQTDPAWRQRYKELFREADRVLCEGSFMAGRVTELGCDPSKVTVHHLGVNVDQIEFRPRQWDEKDKLNILIASSFREKKGIPYAIKALGMLAKDIDLQITIIGEASATPGSQKEKEKYWMPSKKPD